MPSEAMSRVRELGELHTLPRDHRVVRDLDASEAQFSHADLSSLRADNIDFTRAKLNGSRFEHAHLDGCSFAGAILDNSELTEAICRVCVFDRASARYARLQRACIEDSTAEGIDLTGADLRGARLSETRFVRAILAQAVLDEVSGAGVSLRGADLRGASMRGASLIDVDFRGADMTGADLSGATLTGADFRGAILDGVIWDGAARRCARFDDEADSPDIVPRTAPPPMHAAAKAAVDALGELLRSAIRDPRLSALADPAYQDGASPEYLRQLTGALRDELSARGIETSEFLQPFEQLIATLDMATDAEPPEAWRGWLEGVMGSPPPTIASILTLLQRNYDPPDAGEPR